jgi:hypothetical protein
MSGNVLLKREYIQCNTHTQGPVLQSFLFSIFRLMLSLLIYMSVHALWDFWQLRINSSRITQRTNTQFGYHRACSEKGSSVGRQAHSRVRSENSESDRHYMKERDGVGFVYVCDNIKMYNIF